MAPICAADELGLEMPRFRSNPWQFRSSATEHAEQPGDLQGCQLSGKIDPGKRQVGDRIVFILALRHVIETFGLLHDIAGGKGEKGGTKGRETKSFHKHFTYISIGCPVKTDGRPLSGRPVRIRYRSVISSIR